MAETFWEWLKRNGKRHLGGINVKAITQPFVEFLVGFLGCIFGGVCTVILIHEVTASMWLVLLGLLPVEILFALAFFHAMYRIEKEDCR